MWVGISINNNILKAETQPPPKIWSWHLFKNQRILNENETSTIDDLSFWLLTDSQLSTKGRPKMALKHLIKFTQQIKDLLRPHDDRRIKNPLTSTNTD